MTARSERDLYEPVRRELAEKFSVSGDVHLEVSADGRISEKVKEKLDDVSLHIINFERVKPDIIGFVRFETRIGRGTGYFQDEKIVVEVKRYKLGSLILFRPRHMPRSSMRRMPSWYHLNRFQRNSKGSLR